jgi:hypothetical protein
MFAAEIRILKKHGQPRRIVTDGLCSYSAAMKELGSDRQEVGGRLNNRAENSDRENVARIQGDRRGARRHFVVGGDVTSLLPVVDRLRERFSIGRVCVVADRGMISAATIAGLEQRKLEYILGARERSGAVVRKIVLENDDPFVLCSSSARRRDPALRQAGQGRRRSLCCLPQRGGGRE